MLHNTIARFEDYANISLDTLTISDERLNIDSKERSNLFPWNGQFSPQLIQVLLETYAQSDSVVLDPFLGSGTVLHEAGRLGLPAYGTEINPAAFMMANSYRFINLDLGTRTAVLTSLDSRLHNTLPNNLPIFARDDEPTTPAALKLALTTLYATDLTTWERMLLSALIVVLDFYNDDLTLSRVFDRWAKLKTKILGLPFSTAPITLANRDARLLGLDDHSVDLVVTSPPYINVFNYHQHYRASVEALGWNLLTVASSEIGSNRKHRGNRFLTVIQYCVDMTAVLRELRRVCKTTSRIIIVVGRESNVRKTNFFNGEIVAALACRSAGLQPLGRQVRVFKNRFGMLIYEDLLHFTPNGTNSTYTPLDIAKAVLTDALQRAPDESHQDLRIALEKADSVKGSALYDLRQAHTVPFTRKGFH